MVLDLFSSAAVEFHSGATMHVLLRSALHRHALEHLVLRSRNEGEQ